MITDEKITALRGVGPALAEKLAKLGIETVGDMLTFYPRALEDRSVITKIANTVDGEFACINAMAVSPMTERRANNLTISQMTVKDDSGSMLCVFFNNKYVRNSFKVGTWYTFYGRVQYNFGRREIITPVYEEMEKSEKTKRIIPVYSATAGLNQTNLRKIERAAIDISRDSLYDPLPEYIRRENRLCDYSYALENIHFPKDLTAFTTARERLVFEELFLLQIALRGIRENINRGAALKMGQKNADGFLATLPFSLTNAQVKVLDEIISDMHGSRPMNRLVQGDVGCGKTIVAAAAMFLAVKSGYQCALMAPTSILASQHFESLSKTFEPFGIRVALLVGSMTAKEKRETLASLLSGEIDIIIGTHALIESRVEFSNLGLIITDEQHRFGVRQRGALAKKGVDPHVLVMTATPIPRTLALILYGDMDVSFIDELPPGRKKVKTFAVDSSYKERIYNFMRKQVEEGHQCYFVCPMVDESDNTDLESVVKTANELQSAVFPDLRVALVHGKMKAAEKDGVMANFAKGDIDILVSTTVIEVGINVPNATLMTVINAERFGLSQLHQLRGRIGRGAAESYCILISDAENDVAKARLDAMRKTSDGSLIAQKDLELRGPGEFFGTRQHGLPELKIADLVNDIKVVKLTGALADKIYETDPHLEMEQHELLRRAITAFFDKNDKNMLSAQ